MNAILRGMGAPESWIQIVDRVRREKGMSQDDLAFAARGHGAPSTLTGSWISQLKRGTRPLAPDLLAGIAGALGLRPEAFAEYRLAKARQLLDEQQVGLEAAVENLGRVDGLNDEVDLALEDLGGIAEAGVPPPASEKARPRSRAKRSAREAG